MTQFPEIVEVKPMPGYHIWVKFSDNREGKVDLSSLKGKGVFSFWNEEENFKKVHIDGITGAIAWSEELDICPDSIYLQLIGKTFKEYAKD